MGELSISSLNGPRGLDSASQVKFILEKANELLKQHKLDLTHVTMANLYIKDMKEFVSINTVYKQFFNIKPASRACIEVPILHDDNRVIMEFKGVVNKDKVDTLHVQSLSHWAPANIGPYSQANNVINRTKQ